MPLPTCPAAPQLAAVSGDGAHHYRRAGLLAKAAAAHAAAELAALPSPPPSAAAAAPPAPVLPGLPVMALMAKALAEQAGEFVRKVMCRHARLLMWALPAP